MFIVRFCGGLGNQLFQYAFLVALSKHYSEEVLIDLGSYKAYYSHNGFELNTVFNLNLVEATKSQIRRYVFFNPNRGIYKRLSLLSPRRKTSFREKDFGSICPEVYSYPGGCYFFGYWQHFEYFDRYRDEIVPSLSLRADLDGRNSSLMEKLKSQGNCVSIHVRRRDYLKHDKYKGICGLDYYRRAMAKARELLNGERALFYIFSDDMEWCRAAFRELTDPGDIEYVDWNTGVENYKDMILMSSCRINIIAHSSFSWWAAYLNRRPDKAVICPGKWINGEVKDDIRMSDWLRIGE